MRVDLRRLARAPATPGVVIALAAAVMSGPDLPAQIHRAWLVRHGVVLWHTHWYAGHQLPGYSVLAPLLGALVGARMLGAVASAATAPLLVRLARARWPGSPPGALRWLAVAPAVNVAVGRTTFALGLFFAAAALAVARTRRRAAWAGLLALAAALSSPLAGALLAIAALAWAAVTRAARTVVVAAGAASGLALLAPFATGGTFPYPAGTLAATLLGLLAVGVVVDDRTMRLTVLALGCVAVTAFAVPNAVGGNLVRATGLFAGPLVVLGGIAARRPRGLVALIAVPLFALQVLPVGSSLTTDASAHPEYYRDVVAYLRTRPPARVEVPFTRDHWEAAYLARAVPLARGWERQLDVVRNAPLYRDGLTAPRYREWLDAAAVGYVAVPDVAVDGSARRELALLRDPPSYLVEVFRDAHWRVFAVRDAVPLVSGRGEAVATSPGGIDVRVQPGRTLVRVRWTPYWQLRGVRGCLTRSPEGWTELIATTAGTARLRAALTWAGLHPEGDGAIPPYCSH